MGRCFHDDREQMVYAKSLVVDALAKSWPLARLMYQCGSRGGERGVMTTATLPGMAALSLVTTPSSSPPASPMKSCAHPRRAALRLKFRLKPDGVLFGWDIERPGGGISRFDMPGGDFLETRY